MVAREGKGRIVMLLENNPYPRDVRVRLEAQSLTRAGYRVTVIAPRACDQARCEVIDGVSVRRFRNVEGSSALGFVAEYLIAAMRLQLAGLRELLRGADILHLHNPPDVAFPLGAIFRLARRKVIFDHHDLFPETIEAKFGTRAVSRIARLCERWTFRVANHVLATNDSYAEIALERGAKTRREVTVVRNAPPAEWLMFPSMVRPGQLTSVRLGYLGAVSNQDGLEGLVPVLVDLRGRGIDASLLVVGDGDACQALQARMQHEGLSDRLTITGWTAWERVPELLGDVDLCIDPAPPTPVNDRSTMIKIAEYLALGKPVVAFDLTETRRTAADAAMLVARGDAVAFADTIEALARHPEQRERLARLARQRAAMLTWPHSERALLKAYATLLLA